MHLNKSIITQVQEIAARGRSLLSEGKAIESIRVIEKLLALDPDDVNVCICVSSQLIDASSALGDITLADRGIELIERALAEWTGSSAETDIQFRYNLSNGYSVKYKYHQEKEQAEEAEENLQRQKHLLQSILARREHIPDELAPAVITNYANTLDHLSRTFEAVDQFLDCLDLEPDHGLAKGNCSTAIQRMLYFNFTQTHRLNNLQACWNLSSSAVANPDGILKWSGPEALDYLTENHSRLRSGIEQWLEDGIATLETFMQHREVDHPKEPAPEWINQVRADRLLLTFNQIPLTSAHETIDDAFFDTLSFGLSEEEENRSIGLIHLFNTIKEEFVTARHLYYLAEKREEELTVHNDVTLYGDPEGDAEFSLISGLLKASFRSSVELLDKIAVFLGLYLNLETSGGRVNFNNVWFENGSPKKGVLHPKIQTALNHNHPLKGLRDFQRDFFRQEYPGPLKDARNATVHQWLRLSWLPVEKGSSGGMSWNIEDFSELTLFVLRQSKAAILQLAAAVNVEEARRRSLDVDSNKKIIPAPLNIRKPISARTVEATDGKYLRRTIGGDGRPACLPFHFHEMRSTQADRGLLDYSALTVPDVTWDDLDPLEIERFRRSIRERRGDASLLDLSDQELAKALGAVEANHEVQAIRVLGLLLFGREETLRDALPTHEVAFQVLSERQVEVNDFFRGPLLRVMEEIEAQFRTRYREEELMVGFLRVGVPDYPEPAFREAVANALIHRDYGRLGAIHVQWHEDRIEISNPGGFPDGVRLDNLLVTPPAPRNPLLADAFKRAGIVERTARGIDTIFYEQLRNGRPAPSYERSTETHVVLVLPGGEANLELARLVAEEGKADRLLGLDDLLLLNRLWLERRITTAEAAELIQKPESEARSRLQSLVERGLVEPRGESRGRFYHLSAATYRRLGEEAAYVRQRGFEPLQQEQMVLQYVENHGRITRGEAAELCRLAPQQATRLLRRLSDKGRLQKHGARKGAWYGPPSNI